MIKITVTDATATRYNETAGDWSGDTYSVISRQITVTGATIQTAFNSLMNIYFGGYGAKYAMPELLNCIKENADGNASIISYVGDDAGYYDENGRYLIDLYLNVDIIVPASIVDLLAD